MARPLFFHQRPNHVDHVVSVHRGNVTNPVSALSVNQGRGIKITATTVIMPTPLSFFSNEIAFGIFFKRELQVVCFNLVCKGPGFNFVAKDKLQESYSSRPNH